MARKIATVPKLLPNLMAASDQVESASTPVPDMNGPPLQSARWWSAARLDGRAALSLLGSRSPELRSGWSCRSSPGSVRPGGVDVGRHLVDRLSLGEP